VGRQIKITTKGDRGMSGVVRFYEEIRPGQLDRYQQLSLIAFNRLYKPDLERLFNPPRGEMPYTYYYNLKSGNKFMVAVLLPESR